MKAGGGHAKGAQFERLICKQLSRWVTNGEKDDCFWRSALSGGRATVAHKKGIDVRQTGDICSVSPEGHALTDVFFIELKFYKDLQIDRFFIEGRGPLHKFWTQAKKQASRHGLTPMLIAKENRKPPIILVKPGWLAKVCAIELSFTYNPEIYTLSAMLKTEFKPWVKKSKPTPTSK